MGWDGEGCGGEPVVVMRVFPASRPAVAPPVHIVRDVDGNTPMGVDDIVAMVVDMARGGEAGHDGEG